MRSVIFIFSIIVLLLIVKLNAQQNKDFNSIMLKAGNNSINIYYGGILRLAGGKVLLQSRNPEIRDVVEKNGKFIFNNSSEPIVVTSLKSTSTSVTTFFLSPNGNQSENGNDFLGIFFSQIPNFDRGVTIWRYKPWNSWTKPIRINGVHEMESWDVQFFYWQYSDGLYGAVIPLSGQGYRTTLGQQNGMFGSKSVSYFDNMAKNDIPQMAIGFGDDPYKLFAQLYEEGLTRMGKKENLVKNKKFPAILENIGWCTWNSSDMGKNLNEKFLLDAAKSFKEANFPLKYIIVDDGWFDQTDSKLNSYKPNNEKFPNGFNPVIKKLKSEFGIADVGLWHAFNGYWQGINPDSELGMKYKKDLFSWTEKISPTQETSDTRTCWFILPYSKQIDKFYDEFHSEIKKQGFSFLKVDNQLINERMCVDNYPIWDGAELYHKSLYNSLANKFGNTIINCMDMTADAYFNFGTTSVARAVEDYFPYEAGENYNLQKGNAAAHVLQAVYNSLYFSQMVYPDFDMFESGNPNATFHAIARAINNGPIYITDKPGEQNFNILFSLILSDGKILRSDTPLLPTEDCLFQIQDSKPFKAYSMKGKVGLLGIWNCADTDKVEGTFKPSDVKGISGEKFGLYEYFSGELKIVGKEDEVPVSLNRLGCKLYYVIPLTDNNGVIGLVNKYNAPAGVVKSSVNSKSIKVTVFEGGKFAAIVKSPPVQVMIDGHDTNYEINGSLVMVDIPLTSKNKQRKIEIIL
ncbi:MAG: Sip1-related alpha-galactosidase [bacterium]